MDLEKLASKKEDDYIKMLQICKNVLGNKAGHLQKIKDSLKDKHPESLKFLDSGSDSSGPPKEPSTKI